MLASTEDTHSSIDIDMVDTEELDEDATHLFPVQSTAKEYERAGAIFDDP